MKILYLHPRAWTGEYPMLVHLKSMGHEVCVLEENRKLPSARRFTADFEAPGDGINTLWYNPRRGIERLLTWPWDRYYRRAFDGRNLAHRVWVVAAAARHFKPDIVIASDGFSYAIPAAFARRLGLLRVPLVVSFIGGDILDCPEAEYGHRRTPATDRLIKTVVHYSNGLRPVSPKLVKVLLTDGAKPERIRMIPSHLVTDISLTDLVFSERHQLAINIRQRYGLAAGVPLVITLSGNQKGKGIHLLAEVWHLVLMRHPSARWLLCGPDDPWLAHGVWSQLEKTGITDTVIATGRLTGRDVFEHLAAADLLINPTLCEGLNMVTVESAAVGTPSICGDGAGVAGWLARHQAGAVVPAGEAAPLVDAILTALADPARRAAWSDAGRAMSAEFSLDHIAAQLVELFESVCKEP